MALNLPSIESGRRAAVDLRPESYNAETDTIHVVWFTNPEAIEQTKTGEKYRCILGTDLAQVDLTYANKGQPIPFGHQKHEPECGPDSRAYIAAFVPGSVTFDGTCGECDVKLSDLESDKPITDKIRSGIFKAVSLEWEPTEEGRDLMTVEQPAEGSRALPIVRVPAWRLRTIAFVPFGADEGAGTRSATPKEDPMDPIVDPKPANPAPAPAPAAVDLGARNRLIIDLGARARLPQNKINDLLLADDKLTEEGARTAILNAWADEQKNEPATQTGVRVSVTKDEADAKLKGISGAMGVRAFGGQYEGEALGFRSRDAYGLCQDLLELQGVPGARQMDKFEVAAVILQGVRTHSTLDFVNVFSNVAQKRAAAEKTLSADYGWWEKVSSRRDFVDYAPETIVDIGGLNNLPHVKEGAEYTMATFGDAAETRFCLKYGVDLALTEEMIVNDRLSLFGRNLTKFLRAAKLTESALAAVSITSNPTMGDGKALFHTDHSNLAGSGAVVSPTTLDAADVALRGMVGLDGAQCGQPMAVLLAPIGKRFGIEQLFSPMYKPTSKTDAITVNIPEANRLYPPQFTGTAWYGLTGDPLAMEHGWLVGEGGPVVQKYAKPERDALVFHARDVFGIKALDFRAFYCNPGA